jgi:hypothetical protein
VGVLAASALVRAGEMTVSSGSGWQVWQAYTRRAAISQVATLLPHRPHSAWL